jgi:hypothetical protein
MVWFNPAIEFEKMLEKMLDISKKSQYERC